MLLQISQISLTTGCEAVWVIVVTGPGAIVVTNRVSAAKVAILVGAAEYVILIWVTVTTFKVTVHGEGAEVIVCVVPVPVTVNVDVVSTT